MSRSAEYSKHDSSFNARVSEREVRKRRLEEAIFYYFKSLGLNASSVSYKVRGGKLIFDYKMLILCPYPDEKQGGLVPLWYRRTVDLINGACEDKPIKPKKVSVAYDASRGCWMLTSV